MIPATSYKDTFGKTLSGVNGTSIQSVFTKPNIADKTAFANISWLPYPYGELPDRGPWIDKEDNWSRELPTPQTEPPGAQGSIVEKPVSNIMLFAAIVGAVWFLTYYKR